MEKKEVNRISILEKKKVKKVKKKLKNFLCKKRTLLLLGGYKYGLLKRNSDSSKY